jgi:hypothetical protein
MGHDMTDRDIVERLRILAEEWSLRSYTVSHALHESADAIDALRAEVARLTSERDALLTAARRAVLALAHTTDPVYAGAYADLSAAINAARAREAEK